MADNTPLTVNRPRPIGICVICKLNREIVSDHRCARCLMRIRRNGGAAYKVAKLKAATAALGAVEMLAAYADETAKKKIDAFQIDVSELLATWAKEPAAQEPPTPEAKTKKPVPAKDKTAGEAA
jgi:hypothetical protein